VPSNGRYIPSVSVSSSMKPPLSTAALSAIVSGSRRIGTVPNTSGPITTREMPVLDRVALIPSTGGTRAITAVRTRRTSRR
jgi:hypothetical protein